MALCKKSDTAASPELSTVSYIPRITTYFWRFIVEEVSKALNRVLY